MIKDVVVGTGIGAVAGVGAVAVAAAGGAEMKRDGIGGSEGTVPHPRRVVGAIIAGARGEESDPALDLGQMRKRIIMEVKMLKRGEGLLPGIVQEGVDQGRLILFRPGRLMVDAVVVRESIGII